MIGNTNATIIIGGGGGGSKAIIRTAEMPDVSLVISQNGTDIESKSTPAITGGIVDFEVDTIGTYTITASGTNITTWTRNVEVTELNTIVECKAGTLQNYTPAQMHTACQGGYFSKMFSLRDTFTYSQTGNILDNHKFFIEDITKSGNSEIVHLRMADKYAGGNFNMNANHAFLYSVNGNSWAGRTTNLGGYKYSDMRQRMMKQGDEVYTCATGIMSDTYSGTLTTGIKFSDLKYTNNNSCSLYIYNSQTDTLTLATSWTANETVYQILFIKGYFKNVGEIDETTFNAGTYYTMSVGGSSSAVYTKATTYVSGTTYYGLYETLQEDGIFADALFNSSFANYLVRFTENAGAGGSSPITSSYSDYCDIACTEEIIGFNKDTRIMSGTTGSNANIGARNIAGEGTMKPAYNFSVQVTGTGYWTRSNMTTGTTNFQFIQDNGSNSGAAANNDKAVRLGFRIG